MLHRRKCNGTDKMRKSRFMEEQVNPAGSSTDILSQRLVRSSEKQPRWIPGVIFSLAKSATSSCDLQTRISLERAIGGEAATSRHNHFNIESMARLILLVAFRWARFKPSRREKASYRVSAVPYRLSRNAKAPTLE